MKLKHQEAELDAMRAQSCDKEDESDLRYSNLEKRSKEMKTKSEQMQNLAITLQVQLAEAHSEVTELKAERDRLVREHDIEKRGLQEALDSAIIERAENDAKWQRDFEQLRTVNSGLK